MKSDYLLLVAFRNLQEELISKVFSLTIVVALNNATDFLLWIKCFITRKMLVRSTFAWSQATIPLAKDFFKQFLNTIWFPLRWHKQLLRIEEWIKVKNDERLQNIFFEYFINVFVPVCYGISDRVTYHRSFGLTQICIYVIYRLSGEIWELLSMHLMYDLASCNA